jgi:alpha-beta hydrolase superfamily lysophospholipase
MKPPDSLLSHPNPAASYAEALERLAVLQARDGAQVHARAHTLLFTHGAATRRVVVWFHGYTDSPNQFARLAQLCFERGWNVLVPRMPHHGLSDPLTPDTALLTAEMLARSADEALDIAAGLGQQVVVGGLSMGGVIAGWLAQQRREVALAVLLAPAFGAYVIPAPLTRLVGEVYARLPNTFQWWDPRVKEGIKQPEISYPRYAMRGVAAFIRLGYAMQDLAHHTPATAKRICVITTETDTAINQAMVEHVVKLWQAQGVPVQTHRFPAALGLDHNFVDPGHPRQRVDIPYPVILSALEQID